MSVTYGQAALLSSGLGSDWEFQNSTGSVAKQEANTIGADGNIVLRSTFDEILNVTETYRAKDKTTLTLPDLGDMAGDYIITGIKVDSDNSGQGALLTLTGHKHVGTTADAPTLTVDSGIAALVTAATGAINFTGGSGTWISTSIEATVQHQEVKGADGGNLGGENHTAELRFTGTAVDGGTIGAGWTALQTNPGITANNTDWQTRSFAAVKSLTLA